MFDMQKVGVAIASLRREADMTQMELADRLGISYQAVSSWERGNTMPDISKLPELAEIFGVSINRLLGQENPIVESAAAGKLEEHLNAVRMVDVQQLEEAAPLLRPRQVQSAAERLPDNLKFSDAADLFPFIGREMVDRLLENLDEKLTINELTAAAPFAGRQTLDRLVCGILEDGAKPTFREIESIIVFLSRSTADQLAGKLLEEGAKPTFREIESIIVFLSRSVVDQLLLQLDEPVTFEMLRRIAPFAGKHTLETLIAGSFSQSAEQSETE